MLDAQVRSTELSARRTPLQSREGEVILRSSCLDARSLGWASQFYEPTAQGFVVVISGQAMEIADDSGGLSSPWH